MRTSARVGSVCLLPLGSASSLLALAACGGGARDSATPAAAPSSIDAGAVAVHVDAAAAGPVFAKSASLDLQAHWPFTSAAKPDVTVYIDVDGFLKTELVKQYALPLLVPLLAAQVSPQGSACEQALVAHARELAIGSLDDGVFSVLRVDADSAAATLAACIAVSKKKSTATTVPGADEAWAIDAGEVTARKGGIIASGPTDRVAASIAGSSASGASGASGAWPAADVGLAAHQYVAAVFDKNDMTGHAALVADDTKFRLAVDAQVPDESVSKMFEQKLLAEKNSTDDTNASPDERATFATIRGALSVTRDGKKLAVALELDEAPSGQAKDLLAFASYGVRTYIANAKEAEARNAIGEIAKDYVIYEQHVLETTATRKLISLPAVPKTVPRGQPYRSTAADWKPWSAIDFSMDAPQYYQYEVKASKDGKTADVLAHGDLNGDGKTSTFSVRLTLDPATKSFRVADTITEVDPDE